LAIDHDKPSKPQCVIKQFFPQGQGTGGLEKAAELFAEEAKRLDELGRHPQIPDRTYAKVIRREGFLSC
jgi:hypothetical protein